MKNNNLKNIKYVFLKLIGNGKFLVEEISSLFNSLFFLFYSYWIKNFPMHFDLDKRLKDACEKIQNLIESSGDSDCINLVDLSQLYVIIIIYLNCTMYIYIYILDLHLIG